MATNQVRYHEAAICLAALPAYRLNDDRSNVIDLLTNLRHYCGREHLDFEQCLRMSAMHYKAEVNGES